ncbi:MAG: hypothetical protein F6J97_09425 [Leptolyngbya sp. SIO4C1]|nr:hypothetical protein [Leptolyngbya sp. SIO4C1]
MAFDLAAFKRNQLIYETTATALRIQLDCKKIAEYDRQIEKRSQLAIALMVMGGLMAFLAVVMAEALEPIPFLLAAALLAAGFILKSRWQRLNIPNLRYQLVQALVDTLSRDTAPSTPFALKLDCSDCIQARKKVETLPHPTRHRWQIDRFCDRWLVLNGRFADGTDFALSLTELAVSKYGWKRSRSGKSKFKRKNKPKGLEIVLELQFPRKRYGAVQVLCSDIQAAIKLPADIRLKGIKCSDQRLSLSVKAPPAWLEATRLHSLITQLFLSAYQVLNLAKQLSQPTVSGGTS